MREVLLSDKTPTYLDANAKKMLEMSRSIAIKAVLNQSSFHRDGTNILWLTWTGSKINRTLPGLGKHYGNLRVQDEGIALCFEGASIEEIADIYKGFLKKCPSALDLAAEFPILE